MNKTKFNLVFLAFLLIGINARGEDVKYEPGKFGIIAYSSSSSYWIGSLLHLSSNISLKPSFMFYKDDNAEKGNGEEVYERDYYGIEIGFYYYTGPVNNFSLYFGPEFGLFSSKVEYTYSDPDSKYSDNVKSYYVDLKIGAQYMFSNNFGLFADIGFGYSRDSEDHDSPYSGDNKTKNNVFRTGRSSLGAVFYFN